MKRRFVWEEELLALATGTQGPASSQQPPPRPPALPAARYHDRLISPTVPGALHCLQPRSLAATFFFPLALGAVCTVPHGAYAEAQPDAANS